MRKLKILLPSIALMIVLAASITIGVYAANQITFSVNSTISFQSPDIAAKIECFKGDTTGAMVHEWENYTETNNTISLKENYNNPWTVGTLSFTTVAGSDAVADIVLTFRITNKTTALPVYAYFALSSDNDKTKIDTDTIDGTNANNTDLITVTFTNTTIESNATQNVTATIHLNKNIKNADTASFNYTLVLSKYNPSQSN